MPLIHYALRRLIDIYFGSIRQRLYRQALY